VTGVPILGQQAIPMGLSLTGVMGPDGRPQILPLSDVYLLVVLHALVSRESANLASSEGIVRLAAQIAAQALASRAPRPAPANPDSAPASPVVTG